MKSKKTIPYGHQWIDQNDINTIVRTLKADWITQGPMVHEFEKDIASYVGTKYAVAFNNETSALLAASFALGIGDGDEVITTPYTFAASSNCFVWLGAKPIFIDISENSFNIDPTLIENAITKKTKAILTVDFAGIPCEYEKILKIAKKHKLFLIEDAAHAIGSKYKNKMIGSFANVTCFSFHPVKTITTGEGGMATTNDVRIYERLKIFRNHGITKDPKKLHKNQGRWYYEMQELGLNLRLTDIQAALGVSQMKKIDNFIKRRRMIAQTYNRSFNDLPVLLPEDDSSSLSAWHLYPIRLNLNELKVTRKRIFNELQSRGLGVQVHYIPLHFQPYYKKRYGFKRGDLPNSEKAYEEEISLPIFPKMTKQEIGKVINDFRYLILKYQKSKTSLVNGLGDNKKALLEEFNLIRTGKDPELSSDFEAVVILSGESLDSNIKTDLHDTEERTFYAIKIFKKILDNGGSPTFVVNGTDNQNTLIANIAKKNGISKVLLVKNPKVPFASTETQAYGFLKLRFKKIAVVTHAYHGARTRLHLIKNLPRNVKFKLFLYDRREMKVEDINREIEKINRYFK